MIQSHLRLLSAVKCNFLLVNSSKNLYYIQMFRNYGLIMMFPKSYLARALSLKAQQNMEKSEKVTSRKIECECMCVCSRSVCLLLNVCLNLLRTKENKHSNGRDFS